MTKEVDKIKKRIRGRATPKSNPDGKVKRIAGEVWDEKKRG